MSEIRGLHGRLECQLFAKTFSDDLDELLPVSNQDNDNYNYDLSVSLQSISAVTAACREIKSSQKFAKLLQVDCTYHDTHLFYFLEISSSFYSWETT